jgi:hypothetical protein
LIEGHRSKQETFVCDPRVRSIVAGRNRRRIFLAFKT